MRHEASNHSRRSKHSPAKQGTASSRHGRSASTASSRRNLRIASALAGAVLLLALGIVWAMPRVSGDTFMGLAGGRDVLQGKLGRPDDWSFTTSGRVWLNQNWGFDALTYLSTRLAGDQGLLAFKALVMAAMVLVGVLAARVRGAGWAAAFLVVTAALIGARWHFELRANLATYLFALALLLVIYLSRSRPPMIWCALPIMALWANSHGGFVLGFALLGLSLAAAAVADAKTQGIVRALRRSAPTAIVLALSALLAIVTSPFGMRNLTLPFGMARETTWRQVFEWKPAWQTTASDLRSLWELLALIGLMGALAIWRRSRRRRAGRSDTDSVTPLALALFDAALVALMAVMAVSSERFISLALLVLAPAVAAQLDLVLHQERSWFITAGAALGLAVALWPSATLVARRYARENPRYGVDQSFFERMIGADLMPFGAAKFLNENGASGRVFNEWRWEGFLRLRCPQLKEFIGGRAQQVYSIETVKAYNELKISGDPAASLAVWEIHLVVVPLEEAYVELAERLAFAPGSHWAVVFYDGSSAVLADLASPSSRALAERAAEGRARFDNGAVARLSQATCRVSIPGDAGSQQILSDLAAANHQLPTGGGPWLLLFAAKAEKAPPIWLVHTLEQENDALEKQPQQVGLARRLQERMSIAEIVANLYTYSPLGQRWIKAQNELKAPLFHVMTAY